MTADRDGKSRRTGQPDLLASLPAERPPASRQAPGIDPAVVEELLTEVRDLREQVAGLREALLAERPAPVPEALTLEALEAWGERLVARIAEAAQTTGAPADDEMIARIGRIQEALVTATAAVKRNNGVLNSIADRSAAEAARKAAAPADDEMLAAIGRMREKVAEADAALRRNNAS